jgi:hypothetical protein
LSLVFSSALHQPIWALGRQLACVRRPRLALRAPDSPPLFEELLGVRSIPLGDGPHRIDPCSMIFVFSL